MTTLTRRNMLALVGGAIAAAAAIPAALALSPAPSIPSDGSTTFNLPDMRGRIPVCLDNMG